MTLTGKQIVDLQTKLQKISVLPKEKQAATMQRELSSEEVQFLQEQQCIFCKIAKGEIPAKWLIYDDGNFTAFLDVSPVSPGHTLVIPKNHYATLPQLPDNLDAACMKLIKILTAAVFEAVDAQGVNILQNNGTAAGQAVHHIHIHIIPRFENDGIVIGKQHRVELTDKQMKDIQERIIEAAKGKAPKKTVYDISGRELTGKETESKSKIGRKQKTKKIIRVKPKIP